MRLKIFCQYFFAGIAAGIANVRGACTVVPRKGVCFAIVR